VDRAFHGRSNVTCAFCAELTQRACFLKETQDVRSQLKWSSERIRNADKWPQRRGAAVKRPTRARIVLHDRLER
jgi:hypothetical protein